MSDWNDFLEEIKKAEDELGSPNEVWYRGQYDCSWELQPSLPRFNDWEKKKKYFLRNLNVYQLDFFQPELMIGKLCLICNIMVFLQGY